MPNELTVFHWHGDTFDLPVGAIRLASSDLTLNQGFIMGDNVMVLQFHSEITIESLQAIIAGAGHELSQQGDFIQSAEFIKEQKDLIAPNNNLIDSLMDYLVK